ncbi:MAG: hypothetical protein ACKO18_09075, partial [Bacteroidota bacterium]
MKNNSTMMGANVTPWLTNRLSGYVVGLLCVLALFASAPQTNAQVSAYGYNNSNTPYVEITGGFLLGTAANDDHRFVDPAVLAGTTSS